MTKFTSFNFSEVEYCTQPNGGVGWAGTGLINEGKVKKGHQLVPQVPFTNTLKSCQLYGQDLLKIWSVSDLVQYAKLY